MKTPFLALLLLAALAPAQTPSPAGSRSDAIIRNVGKLDVLIQVVPLALTKEEITPLLASLERVHQKQKELQALEDKDLLTIDTKTQKLVDDGVNEGKYPPREQQAEIAKFWSVMSLRRNMAAIDFVQIVYDACKASLNAGQLKIMEKALKPELLDPSVKVDQMDGEAKVKFFVRKVLLDPVAYDVLSDMSKKKS